MLTSFSKLLDELAYLGEAADGQCATFGVHEAAGADFDDHYLLVPVPHLLEEAPTVGSGLHHSGGSPQKAGRSGQRLSTK